MNLPPDTTDQQLDAMLENIKEQGELLKEKRIPIAAMFIFSGCSLIARLSEKYVLSLALAVLTLMAIVVWLIYYLEVRKLQKEFRRLEKEVNKICKNGHS